MKKSAILILLIILIISCLPLLGKTILPWHSYLKLLGFEPSDTDSTILSLRLIRTFTAMLTGAGLALGGLLFQTIFRNDLATPYTLGVASAASFGAYLSILLFSASFFISFLFSLGFGLADAFFVFALARFKSKTHTFEVHQSIILIGVMLNYFFAALVLGLRYMADPYELTSMEVWSMGSLQILEPSHAIALMIVTFVLIFLVARKSIHLDLLSFNEEYLSTLSLKPNRLRMFMLLLVMAYTAFLVSLVGPIGFLGLLVPHFVRQNWPSRHRQLIFNVVLAGAIFLPLIDLASRSIALPTGSEIPVGLLTSFVGVPFFLYFLIRQKNR